MPPNFKLETIPAPTGGLNTRDGIANMPPTDAIVLTNWIPDTYGIRSRKGWSEWAINFPGAVPVRSVLPYFSATQAFPAGTFLTAPTQVPGAMFAATDTAIYTVTSRTNAPAVALALTGAANAGLFNSTMFANSAGSFLLACSEADGYFTYDGTTWLRRVAGAAAGEINGVNPNNLVQVCAFKRRAWFVERDTARAWYLPADAIAGTVVAFDFGPQFQRGGHLSFLANWTIDAGEGIDDFLVACSSNGEILVYRGSDPAAAATFAIVGRWLAGQVPVGRRAHCQYGGDLLVLTTEGLAPLSMITRGGSTLLTVQNKEYSSKIAPTMGFDVRTKFTQAGWQLAISVFERILVVTVPIAVGQPAMQYVLSLTTNNWCTFLNVPVICMGIAGGYMFGGTSNGRLLLMFNGSLDGVPFAGTGGTPIVGEVKPAYNYFNSATAVKHFKMVRPWFLSAESPGVFVDMSVNFETAAPQGVLTFPVTVTSNWDSALWDSAIWGGAVGPQTEWAGVAAVGFSGTCSMLTACPSETTLTAIDYMFSLGGPL